MGLRERQEFVELGKLFYTRADSPIRSRPKSKEWRLVGELRECGTGGSTHLYLTVQMFLLPIYICFLSELDQSVDDIEQASVI